jgi:ankyrin repeat protein
MGEIAPATLQPSPDTSVIDRTHLDELLFKGIDKGDLNKVVQALKGGANIEALNEAGDTPLTKAIKEKGIDIIYYLLEKGANINQKDNKGYAPLHYAITNIIHAHNQEEDRASFTILQILYDANVDINITDNNDNTALHYAVISNSANTLKIISTLLPKEGCSINKRNIIGCTPLHYAVRNLVKVRSQDEAKTSSQDEAKTNFTILQTLCDANADVNILDKNNNTALHYAMFSNSANTLKIIRILLEAGAKLLINSEGHTPLTLSQSLQRADFEYIKELLGKTLLGKTAEKEIILSTPPSLEGLCKKNLLAYFLSPSNKAQQNRKKEMLYKLLDAELPKKISMHIGADFGYGNKFIHLATKACNIRLIHDLLQYKYNYQQITYTNLIGQTPFHIAAEKGYPQVVQYLTQYPYSHLNIDTLSVGGYSPLHYALIHGHNPVINCLVQSKADINITDYLGKTPLHYAIHNSSLELVNYLLQNGANINAEDKKKRSPLHGAIKNEQFNIVKYLIDRGANVNQKDKSDLSPLFLAIEERFLPAILYLIEKGANVNEDGGQGITPLAEISLRPFDNDKETAQILRHLIKYGADINRPDRYEDTPLHHAAFQSNAYLVELLIQLGADHTRKNRGDKLASDLGYDDIKNLIDNLTSKKK